MNIYDPKNNITVDLLSKNCLNRDCYVPRIAFHKENTKYICGRRELRGCPEKYIEEERDILCNRRL